MTESSLERPVLAVDVVIFAVRAARLQVLLCRRDEEPFQGVWALPGVAVRVDETLERAARRALLEKAGWPAAGEAQDPEGRDAEVWPYLEQLATFDALFRDPRGRTVSVAHLGLTQTARATAASHWQPVAQIDNGALPFDHAEIVRAAVTRLQGKARYTNIAKALVPDTFRIEDLQTVYEAILDRPVNRANFRMKLLKIGMIAQVSILGDAVGRRGGRPPHLYRFTQELIDIAEREIV